jgi:LysR family transcriptional regulator, mexEF-oprN operon transcriptional activator
MASMTLVDLNLLSTFVTLMQERSVSRAARRLSIGQPAMSHALARLRRAFDDDLFIRQGRQMEPTPRACQLLADIEPSLQHIELSVRASRGFDPQSSRPTFRVGLSDDILLSFLPRITEELMSRLPGASLIVRSTDYIRAGDMLDRNEVSTVIGYLDRLPANARVKRLRTIRYKVLSARSQPRHLTLDAYCSHRHAIVTFAGDLKGYIDEALAEMGAQRRIVLSLPQFAGLPAMIRAGGVLVTVPDFVAETLAAGGVIARPLPFKSPTCGLSMAWRATVDSDPAEKVLRDIIAHVIRK